MSAQVGSHRVTRLRAMPPATTTTPPWVELRTGVVIASMKPPDLEHAPVRPERMINQLDPPVCVVGADRRLVMSHAVG